MYRDIGRRACFAADWDIQGTFDTAVGSHPDDITYNLCHNMGLALCILHSTNRSIRAVEHIGYYIRNFAISHGYNSCRNNRLSNIIIDDNTGQITTIIMADFYNFCSFWYHRCPFY